MRVTRLALTNFRSYKNLELEFPAGPTTFIGNNGSGKTNIAESLIYLAYLSSHRVSSNQPLISLGAEQAIIRAEIESQGRTLQVDLEINANKANRARLNGNPVKSQREILGALQIIYFSPEDLDLVRGEPTHRRDFLDKLLIMRAPRLAGVISDETGTGALVFGTSPAISDPKIAQSINAQTGTTYTFVLADQGKYITASNASAITVSIPTNASVAFPIGTSIDLIQIGAGQVTVSAATPGTTTIYSTGATAAAPKTRVQYSALTCKKISTDVWHVIGDLS